jgi:hypothetical protein
MAQQTWELKGNFHQIADTGDYDGYYEITNGKISLLTKDDDDEALQPIVDALNNSGCRFIQDDWIEFENKMLKKEISRLKFMINAKEMERRQKEDCWDVAHQAGRFEGKGIAEENWQTFEQYYSETYGKKYQRENKKTPPPPPPPPPPNRLLKEGKEPPKPKPKTK